MSRSNTRAALRAPNKQLERNVIPRSGDGASAPFQYALAPRFTRQRAAAELRRYAASSSVSATLWFAAFAASLLATGCARNEPAVSDGVYYGHEARSNVSPDEPEAVWFNENVLTIRAGSVRLEKAPRYLLEGRVFSSASDGGFRTFEGAIEQLGGRTIVGLRQLTCDYCEPPPGDGPLPSTRVREYVVLFNEDGTFELDHVRYSTDKSERPHWLTYQIEFETTE